VARGFTYDGEDRQVTATIGSGTSTYAYDGLGQRVSKTVAGQTTTYVYDAFGNLAAEYGAEPAGACAGTCYVTTDHLGSTRLLTNSAGQVAGRYDYEPFGQEIGAGFDGRMTAQGYTSTPDITNPKFTGQMRDQETTLDWFNVRYYSGAQGRFQSPDPANAGADPSNPQSWNGYSYVANNPLSYTDPSGMFVCTSCVADESGNPVVIGIAAAIDIGELLAGIFEGLLGGPPSSIAPSLATPSSPILQPSPDFDSQGWNAQIPDSTGDPGSLSDPTANGSGGPTGPFASGLCPGGGCQATVDRDVWITRGVALISMLGGPLSYFVGTNLFVYNKVKTNGKWDFKNQPVPGAHAELDDYGNCHFGAIGRGAFLPDIWMRWNAGVASYRHFRSKGKYPPASYGAPWSGPPWGDNPENQRQIGIGEGTGKCTE